MRTSSKYTHACIEHVFTIQANLGLTEYIYMYCSATITHLDLFLDLRTNSEADRAQLGENVRFLDVFALGISFCLHISTHNCSCGCKRSVYKSSLHLERRKIGIQDVSGFFQGRRRFQISRRKFKTVAKGPEIRICGKYEQSVGRRACRKRKASAWTLKNCGKRSSVHAHIIFYSLFISTHTPLVSLS